MSVSSSAKVLMPNITQSEIDVYLPLFDDADVCLSNYSESIQVLTKALAICHMVMMNQGGQVTSESTRTGASASYSVWTGKGLESTQYGQQLNGLPSAQCVINLFSKPQRFIKGVTPLWD